MQGVKDLQRDEVIANNLGLVHACANRFRARGIEYDDLFQAGCIGLIKAADAFDWQRGVRFSTYAVPVILGEIRRLFRDGGAVKVSRSIKELSLKINRERERFCVRCGREPAVSELAELLDTPADDIVAAITALTPPVSLTEEDEDGQRQMDLPVDSPEEQLSDLLALQQGLAQLCELDRKLIELRYFAHKTQSQTAGVLGMTQVQVSRREKKILLQLRSMLLGP